MKQVIIQPGNGVGVYYSIPRFHELCSTNG